MANLSSIARPYALAAFEYARTAEQLENWKVFLNTAADVAAAPAMQNVLDNPEIEIAKKTGLFKDVLKSMLDKERENFLSLLAQHNRFNVLPDIAEKFNHYLEALEEISKVRVVTAIKAQEDFNKKLAQVLSSHIKKEVTLENEVNEEILGGAVIHIGDRVIDGSLRGKLSRLRKSLSA